MMQEVPLRLDLYLYHEPSHHLRVSGRLAFRAPVRVVRETGSQTCLLFLHHEEHLWSSRWDAIRSDEP